MMLVIFRVTSWIVFDFSARLIDVPSEPNEIWLGGQFDNEGNTASQTISGTTY